jgi:hypothetical protein
MKPAAIAKGILCFFLTAFFLIQNAQSQIVINEISSRNATIYTEQSKDYADFIEIYNYSNSAINLNNFYLSNVKATPMKWRFFNQNLSAGQYTLVFADEDNVYTPNNTFQHTNFKISMGGETVYLSNAAGVIIDSIVSPKNIEINQSAGKPLGSTIGQVFYNQMTPNAANITTAYAARAGAVIINKLGAKYILGTTPITVTATCPTGQSALYTTNCDTPKEGVDNIITATGISFDTTTVFRARCVGAGLLPGVAKTETFIFNENTTLPIVSITTDCNNLWGYTTGILADGPNASQFHGANFYKEWRRPSKVEFFDAVGVKKFVKDASINTDGNSSLAAPKKSLRVNFSHTTLGDSKLAYEMFPNTRPGLASFKNIKLRAGGNIYTAPNGGGGGGVIFHEGAVESFAKNLNVSIAAYRPTVFYLNGKYWGVYEIRERLDASLYKNTLGANEDSIYTYDKQGWDNYPEELLYTNITNQIANEPAKNTAAYYNYFTSKFDVKNFIDYLSTEIHFQNIDWIGSYDIVNNLVIWKDYSAVSDKKYRFSLKDFDMSYCIGSNANMINAVLTTPATNPLPTTFKSLIQNNQFKKEFINRYADIVNYYFHKDTLLNAIANYQAEVQAEIADECDRWTTNTTGTWEYRYQNMRTCMASRNVTGMEEIDAALLGNAGTTSITLKSQPANGGKILFNTIKPNLPWTGTYFKGNEIPFTAQPNPGYAFVGWTTNNRSIRNEDLETISLDTSFTSTTTLTAVFRNTSLLSNKLLRFTANANDCNVGVNWSMDTDEEITQYEVQRKTAFDIDYVTVYKTNSLKSVHEINYSTTIVSTGNAEQYRLKMIDDQRKVTYSTIALAKTNCTNFNVQVQTNPVSDNVVLNINNTTNNQICTISIYNSLGELVLNKKENLQGSGLIKAAVQNLSAGIYAVKVSVGNDNAVVRFLKK